MSDRYFLDRALALGPVTLEGAEAHHLATVCRARPDGAVCLFNGDGCEYPARVVEVLRRQVKLEIVARECPDRELPFHLDIAAPLPKGDRAQFLLEKLTELGVARFVPIQTSRSIGHRAEFRRDRLERHVIEASKQCGRNRLLQVAPMIDWKGYCTGSNLPALRFLAEPSVPGSSLPSALACASGYDTTSKPEARVGHDTTSKPEARARGAAVGPEGGFTPEEVSMAVANGWQLVGLGERVLRVETAAMLLAVLLSR